MIEKFQDWLIPKVGSDKAYYFTIALYMSIMFFTLGLNGWLLDNWCMVITASIVINTIRIFTSGFHEKSLVRCIILTNILMIIFGYIAKHSTDSMGFVFLLMSLFCIKDIYLCAPITETDYKDRNSLWHKKKAIKFVCLFIFSAIILAELNYVFIAKSILLSIVMVDVLLFKNMGGV